MTAGICYFTPMPELPEVETVCRGLRPDLEGQRLTKVVQRRADLRFPFPPNFARRLHQARIASIARRAKFILLHLEGGATMIAHLGMSGRFATLAPPVPDPGPHDHVDLETEAGMTIRYTDPRRFGFMDLCPTATLDVHPMLRDLGPEPLSRAFNAAALGQTLAGRRTPIKTALLDQGVVAGLGNIYVCEALYVAGISPRRSARTIPGQRAERLVPAVKSVLRAALRAGGSSLRDYAQVDGTLGYFQHRWKVYGREGKSCRMPGCDGMVARMTQSGRSTFFCPRHQR